MEELNQTYVGDASYMDNFLYIDGFKEALRIKNNFSSLYLTPILWHILLYCNNGFGNTNNSTVPIPSVHL